MTSRGFGTTSTGIFSEINSFPAESVNTATAPAAIASETNFAP